jgi:hypothetical protein
MGLFGKKVPLYQLRGKDKKSWKTWKWGVKGGKVCTVKHLHALDSY